MDNPHEALINAYKAYVDSVHFFQNLTLDAIRSGSVDDFIGYLEKDAKERFEVDEVHLVLGGAPEQINDLHPALRVTTNAAVAAYRGDADVLTRAIKKTIISSLEGMNGNGSEAVLNIAPADIDFEAILVLSSSDKSRFSVDQGTDLIQFYREALVAKMEQWLAQNS